jgi:hypothetical protein
VLRPLQQGTLPSLNHCRTLLLSVYTQHPPGASSQEGVCSGGSGSGTVAATLQSPPLAVMAPGPECAWEEQTGNDTFILITYEELAACT